MSYRPVLLSQPPERYSGRIADIREKSMLANTTRALTEEQREQWAVDGYLQLEGALSPAEVDFFAAQIDRVRMQPGYEPAPGKLPRGHYAWVDHADPNPAAFMD